MPDHYHAVIEPPQGRTISDTLHHINGVFAARYHAFAGINGKVFQKMFWDHGIRNEQDYFEKTLYIHANPVRAELAKSPEEYLWSSARNRVLNDHSIFRVDPPPF